jgi:hypothetical protein
MTGKRWCALLVVAAALPCGATAAAADKAAAKPPSCMQCGATCGLRAVCVSTPDTKTVPKPEFSTTCEPICIAGCGSRPWPWCRQGRASGCTSCTDCGDEPCVCAGRVRQRKVLVRKTVDTEKPVVKRSVGHLCCRCEAARQPQCHASCAQAGTWRRCLDWLAGFWSP